MDSNASRKQRFRERILGSEPVASAPPSSHWVELPPESPAPRPRVVEVILTPEVLDDEDVGARYFNEKFVRGKLENWAGRPAGVGGQPADWGEEAAAQRELRISDSPIPIDPTDAEITARTIAAMDEITTGALIRFHTENMPVGRIAYQVGLTYAKCLATLKQGHVDFCLEWKDQQARYDEKLRHLAPPVDPSRDAVGQLCLPRIKPKPSDVVTYKPPPGKPRQC